MTAPRLAIALVHYPVLDGAGATVTSAITNLDVHDLARSARTYGCSDYFIVHPIAAQRALVERICAHWAEGSSGKRIPDRKEALALVRVVSSLDEAVDRLRPCEVWVTAARDLGGPATTFGEARQLLEDRSALVVFGTGWGLAAEIVARATRVIEPIRAKRTAGDYNHLSVRSACAIALDRLKGA